jgi:hypothetical protein
MLILIINILNKVDLIYLLLKYAFMWDILFLNIFKFIKYYVNNNNIIINIIFYIKKFLYTKIF